MVLDLHKLCIFCVNEALGFECSERNVSEKCDSVAVNIFIGTKTYLLVKCWPQANRMGPPLVPQRPRATINLEELYSSYRYVTLLSYIRLGSSVRRLLQRLICSGQYGFFPFANQIFSAWAMWYLRDHRNGRIRKPDNAPGKLIALFLIMKTN